MKYVHTQLMPSSTNSHLAIKKNREIVPTSHTSEPLYIWNPQSSNAEYNVQGKSIWQNIPYTVLPVT